METCTAEYEKLTANMPNLRCDGNAVVTITNPAHLDNVTMPIIELTLIAGMVAGLIHAIRWYRAQGDASNLVVWCGSVLTLLLIEPLAYFPQWFGVEDSLGLTFAHNMFTVQFLYDRMPLYIVAMYPFYAYVAYTLVQRAGVFQKYNIWVQAASVAFVFHCLYEIADHVGPQLKWWVWNDGLSTSHPSFGGVPLLNMSAFTVAIPFGLTLATRWLASKPHRSGWYVVRDVAVVTVLAWPIQGVASLIPTIVDLVGGSLSVARAVVAWTVLAVVAAVAVGAFIGACRARLRNPDLVPDAIRRDRFPLIWVTIYVLVMAAIWIYALPDYFAAKNGVAETGGHVGYFWYAVVAFVITVALTVLAYTGRRSPAGASDTENRQSDPTAVPAS